MSTERLAALADEYFRESPKTLEEGYRFTATDWVHDFARWLASRGLAFAPSIREWIAALPPDAITQVCNAGRDAYDAALGKGRPWHEAHSLSAAAVRDALLSLVRAGVRSRPPDSDDVSEPPSGGTP